MRITFAMWEAFLVRSAFFAFETCDACRASSLLWGGEVPQRPLLRVSRPEERLLTPHDNLLFSGE